jgi:hypothetical protein
MHTLLHGDFYVWSGGVAMSITTGNLPVYADGRSVGTVTVSQNGLMTVFNCACSFNSRDILRLAAVCAGRYVPLGVVMPDAGPDTLRFKKSFSKNTLTAMGYDDPLSYHLIRPGEVWRETAEEHSSAVIAPAAPAEEQQTIPMSPAASSAPPMPGYSADGSRPGTSRAETDSGSPPEPLSGETPLPLQLQDTASDEVTEELLAALLEMTLKNRAEASGAAETSALVDAPPPDDVWYPAENPASLFDDPEIAKSCENVMGALAKTEDDTLLLAVPVSPDEPFSMMPVFCFGSPRQIDSMDYIVFKIKDGYLTL